MHLTYPHSGRSTEKGAVKPVSIALLVGLLALRIPFYGGMGLLFDRQAWVGVVFEIATYLMTAVLIWLERERLDDSFITPLALWIILVMKPLSPVLVYLMGLREDPLVFPHPLSFAYLLIAAGLFLALRRSGWRPGKVSLGEWKWLGWGSLAGLVTAIGLSLPLGLALRAAGDVNYNPIGDIVIILLRIPQQMGYASVTEEPVFRGFLWGFLIRAQWKQGSILALQAVLFTLGHMYNLRTFPFAFWVTVPVGALVLGGLVWRSRSLTSSLGAHAWMNAFGLFFAQLARVLFLRG